MSCVLLLFLALSGCRNGRMEQAIVAAIMERPILILGAATAYYEEVGRWPSSTCDLAAFEDGHLFDIDWASLQDTIIFEQLPDGRLKITSTDPHYRFTLTTDIAPDQDENEDKWCDVSHPTGSEGTGAQLVAAIPDSLKPFTLYLSSTAAPDRLYPGSVVDVLFSPKLSGRDAPGKATVTTILRGIQVLAVEGNSVVSNPEQEGEAKTRRVGGGVQVTLLVYKEQAEALRWAVGRGNISLAIRNPLDKRNVPNRNRLAPDLPTDADPEHLRAFGGMLGD